SLVKDHIPVDWPTTSPATANDLAEKPQISTSSSWLPRESTNLVTDDQLENRMQWYPQLLRFCDRTYTLAATNQANQDYTGNQDCLLTWSSSRANLEYAGNQGCLLTSPAVPSDYTQVEEPTEAVSKYHIPVFPDNLVEPVRKKLSELHITTPESSWCLLGASIALPPSPTIPSAVPQLNTPSTLKITFPGDLSPTLITLPPSRTLPPLPTIPRAVPQLNTLPTVPSLAKENPRRQPEKKATVSTIKITLTGDISPTLITLSPSRTLLPLPTILRAVPQPNTLPTFPSLAKESPRRQQEKKARVSPPEIASSGNPSPAPVALPPSPTIPPAVPQLNMPSTVPSLLLPSAGPSLTPAKSSIPDVPVKPSGTTIPPAAPQLNTPSTVPSVLLPSAGPSSTPAKSFIPDAPVKLFEVTSSGTKSSKTKAKDHTSFFKAGPKASSSARGRNGPKSAHGTDKSSRAKTSTQKEGERTSYLSPEAMYGTYAGTSTGTEHPSQVLPDSVTEPPPSQILSDSFTEPLPSQALPETVIEPPTSPISLTQGPTLPDQPVQNAEVPDKEQGNLLTPTQRSVLNPIPVLAQEQPERNASASADLPGANTMGNGAMAPLQGLTTVLPEL
ncbi:MAG: hypothetical protein Q9226_009023, partial [Calogaya cf. arnoldii]